MKTLITAFLLLLIGSGAFSQANTTGLKGDVSVNGSTNGVLLGPTSGIQLYGTATQYNDMVTTAIQTKVTPATSLPALSLDSLALLFVHDPDSNERAYFSLQLSHSYKPGSSAYPHFHWIQYNAADTFNIALKYRVHKLGGSSGPWIWVRSSEISCLTFTAAPFHQIARFPTIPLVGINESTMIDFVMYRYDSYGLATAYIKSFDPHIEFEKLGTNNEIP